MHGAPPKHARFYTEGETLRFVLLLCLLCGLLLSVVSYALRVPQQRAKAFDEHKQMLIAAALLTHGDTFRLAEGASFVPAAVDLSQKILLPVSGKPPKASEKEIEAVASWRIRPLLTDAEGSIVTLEERGMTLDEYRKADDPRYHLFYGLLGNEPESSGWTEKEVAHNPKLLSGLLIPISGFGLWGPIHGYLALSADGNRVLGTSWYDHMETPGLGANITEGWWQEQFYGKAIFHASPDGTTDFHTAELGITVVKGKVGDVYGKGPLAKSAVDGISGATITGNGVTAAYQQSLLPYRALLRNLQGAS